ncbi:thioesterase-like superfamily-domain-containing protein [Hyaloraphidium curvatum]|nr:thioesterase-like superfamily-domain-containing protein [Hyaloraphidium curvatum]
MEPATASEIPPSEAPDAVSTSSAPFRLATATHFVRTLPAAGVSSADAEDDDDGALWRGRIASEFLTGIAPFGGYVIALFLSACRGEIARRGLQTKFPDPVSISATFLAPGREGPVDITVGVLREGGRFLVMQFAVRQRQGGRTVALVAGTLTFSDMGNESGDTDLTQIPAPALPPREECSASSWTGRLNQPGPKKSFWQMLETLEPPYGEEALEKAQIARGWTKWARWTGPGDDVRTAESLAFFSDLYGMPAFRSMGAWFPTMDYQAQFRHRALPSDGDWLRIRSCSRYTTNGRKEFDVELWNEDGTKLLCIARQMTIIVDAKKRMEKNKAAKL